MLLPIVAAPTTSPIRSRASTAALVEVERIVPPAFVVRVDPEVVQRVRLPEEVAELFVDRQREVADARRVRGCPSDV